MDWKTLHNGLICPDRTWRQIVTLEDVVNHGWKHTDIDEIRDENTEDEFLNLYMCEFVREGESAFNLNILIGCGVDGYDDWKDWKPFAPRPMGNRPVWIGYDANGSSGNGDSGAVSVVVPPAVPLAAVFERWRRDAFRGWSLKNRPESLKSSRVATTWNTSALM